jgi:hypothetical protein
VPLLSANQTFSASNTFSGVAQLTNVLNSLVGNHAGDGSGLSNVPAATLTGTAPSAAVAANFSGNLAGDVTGTQGATVVGTVGGVSAANVATGANAANGAASADTANALVKRDGSGGFSAGTVTGTFVGDGSGLTKLNAGQLASGTVADGRLSANVPLLSANQTFSASNTFSGVAQLTNVLNSLVGNHAGDGSGLSNVPAATLTGTAPSAAVAANFSGNLAGDVTGTQGATVVGTVGGVSAANVATGANAANGAASADTANALVKRDGSGGFSAGTVTGTFVGDGSGLTKLNAGQLASGTVADGRLSANVPLLSANQTFSASNTFSGVAQLTNVLNSLVGNHAGDGSGLSNVPAATLTGTAPSAAVAANFSGNLAGDVTGTQGATVVGTVGGVSAANVATGANAANGAASANAAGTIVKRDSNGNFAAGAITGRFVGDGSALTALNAANLTGTIDDWRLSFDAASAIAAANGATSANTAGAIVKRDSSGNFAAGTMTGAFAGDGSGLTALNAASLTGTVADGRLSANVALLGANQTFAGAARLTNTANLLVGAHAGDGSGLTNLTGTLNGSASSATHFSGALAGDVTGTQNATVVGSVGGATAANVASGAVAANAATSANAAGTIVKRDSNGNFAAGTVTGAFLGAGGGLTNLSATNLTGILPDARLSANVALLGANQTFAGAVRLTNSANLLVGAHVGDGSGLTNLNVASLTAVAVSATNFFGLLAGDVTGPQTGTVVATVAGVSATNLAAGATAANAATSTNLPYTIVQRDTNGNFQAGTVTGNFVGNGIGLTNLSATNLTGAIPSAVMQASIPSGLMVVSPLAQDPSLVTNGYQFVMSVPAPAWVNGATTGAPSARSGHTAAWDGQEMIVWGGDISSEVPTFTSSGGMYRPDLDQWTAVSTLNAPSARAGHTAVWTGTEMIVWGGYTAGGTLNTGAKFNPVTQTWTPASTAGAPSGRSGHIAVWTGTSMLVWGGANSVGLLGDAALYDPVADQWTSVVLPGAFPGSQGAKAAWTGDRVLIWGGDGQTGPSNAGIELLFSSDGVPTQWSGMALANAPSARDSHSAVWTGQKFMVWGGSSGGVALGDGAAFDVLHNTWTNLPSAGAPAASFNQVAVWTGQEMLVIGGSTGSSDLASGAAYNPATGRWRPLSTQGNPVARSGGGGVWSGTEVMIFGGRSGVQFVGALQRLNPQPPWYFYRKL